MGGSMIIDSRKILLGGSFEVSRVLPIKSKRQLGPFVFLDHMGPHHSAAGQNVDVGAHPHIGLSTLTYLLEGRSVHRDSLGTKMTIEPGDVNWMTAGHGVSHSERTHVDDLNSEKVFHGLQFWVALPDALEDCEPHFANYKKSTIPSLENSKMKITTVAGEFIGIKSPVITSSPLVLAHVIAKETSVLELSSLKDFEIGVYILAGEVIHGDSKARSGQLLVIDFSKGHQLKLQSGCQAIVFGGEKLYTEKHIWWNFVSSSKEKISEAENRWRSGLFPMPIEETEPLPAPVRVN